MSHNATIRLADITQRRMHSATPMGWACPHTHFKVKHMQWNHKKNMYRY